MNRHAYECDELVIGSGLNAVMYAYFNPCSLILNTHEKPWFFDFFDHSMELDKIQMDSPSYRLRGLYSSKLVGPSKLEAWERLCFIMSLSGKIPMSDKTASIRIEPNKVKVTTRNFRMSAFKFNKLRIFDDENIVGLGIPKEENNQYRVADWIDVQSGMVHERDYLETGDKFVKDIYFYPSKRMDDTSKRKDLVAVSHIDREQLQSFEFSDTYVRFKTLSLMKQAGLKGARNGRDQKNPDKYKYYALKIQPRLREIRKVKPNIYESTDNITFDCRSEEEIYKVSEIPGDYSWKLNLAAAKR